MAIKIGVVMKVVASAMRTIIANRAGDTTPRSSPAFTTTSSTSPRVFSKTPRQIESFQFIPVALAVRAAPASLPRTAVMSPSVSTLRSALLPTNLLNHQNFDLPINSVVSGGFGAIVSTIGSNTNPYGAFFGVPLNGRILQVFGRFSF
jgi:hypothetical protein